MDALLRSLPKVDECLKDPLFSHAKSRILKPIIQEKIQNLRELILAGKLQKIDLPHLKEAILKTYTQQTQSSIRSLINATGVVLQTNLGRSLIHPKILEEIAPLLCSYNNLEYDTKTGKRSERYIHLKRLLCTLLQCEDILVVNNNASAVLLILNTFAKDREVLISRGELVEIGGAFRIPEVMKLSGSHLVEVGTTNKTYLSDYEEAITAQSALLMKAHQSNFKQLGFCASVDFKDLSLLAQKHNLIDYYDLGSGYMQGLQTKEEPSILELCSHSPSLLSFSGDKLFGGPQAGIIVGKSQLIAKLKKNHLLRALRVDKFTILALEATLRAYLSEEFDKIPTLAFLNTPLEVLHQKAQALLSLLKHSLPSLVSYLEEVHSLAGGGSLPQTTFQSYAVLCHSQEFKTSALEQKLRENGLVARITQDKICLDVRCLLEEDFEKIPQIFQTSLLDLKAEQNETKQ